jgi:hypothetical protein
LLESLVLDIEGSHLGELAVEGIESGIDAVSYLVLAFPGLNPDWTPLDWTALNGPLLDDHYSLDVLGRRTTAAVTAASELVRRIAECYFAWAPRLHPIKFYY